MVRLLMFNALTSKWDNPVPEGQENLFFFLNRRENIIVAIPFFSLK